MVEGRRRRGGRRGCNCIEAPAHRHVRLQYHPQVAHPHCCALTTLAPPALPLAHPPAATAKLDDDPATVRRVQKPGSGMGFRSKEEVAGATIEA